MSLGHFLMAFEFSFLGALLCLLLGVGCFKGNLASQVGALYPTGDNRRADAFQIYYLFINGAVIISPLVTGTLGEKVGWHWGFGAAGVGMLFGLAIYLAGRKYLPPDSPVVEKHAKKSPLTHRDRMAIFALLALLPIITIAIIGNQQIFNAYLVWAEKTANLPFFRGEKMPITWLITLDAILSISCLAGAVVFWRFWSEEVSRTHGNNQAWHWQPHCCDRISLFGNGRRTCRSRRARFRLAGSLPFICSTASDSPTFFQFRSRCTRA